MKKSYLAAVIIFFLILISIFITIAPTFFTKGVSRVSLHQNIDLSLILDTPKEIELVFFGYAGCTDICTPRLHNIAEWYQQSIYKDEVQVRFLDISRPYDTFLPQLFAASFNKEFIGVYLKEDFLREYTKEFSVYFARSFRDEHEFDHTANLYLLKRSKNFKELRYIYSAYPYDFKQITADIEELIHE